MRVKGNSPVPFAVMGGVLLGIGLLFSVETLAFSIRRWRPRARFGSPVGPDTWSNIENRMVDRPQSGSKVLGGRACCTGAGIT
jgi:hypothetical protein